jgi:hypothetical protein
MQAGTIRSVRERIGKGPRRFDVQVRVPAGTLAATLVPDVSDAHLVRVGATGTVEVYRGEVTAVFIDRRPIRSTTNPYERDDDFHTNGFGLIGIGLAVLSGAAYAMRSSR